MLFVAFHLRKLLKVNCMKKSVAFCQVKGVYHVEAKNPQGINIKEQIKNVQPVRILMNQYTDRVVYAKTLCKSRKRCALHLFLHEICTCKLRSKYGQLKSPSVVRDYFLKEQVSTH